MATLSEARDVTILVEGARGLSNYQIWLRNGHAGTEADYITWLAAQATAVAQPSVDAAIAAAASAAASEAAMAAAAKEGRGWNRPTPARGVTATYYDHSLDQPLAWDGSAWRLRDGSVAPAYSYILDQLSVQPVFYMCNQPVRAADVAGKRFRVANAAAETRDVSTPGEAEAGGFNPTTVTHYYETISASWKGISPAATYTVERGLIAPKATGLTTSVFPPAALAAFNAAPGAMLMTAVSNMSETTASANYIFVSGGVNASNARVALTSASGELVVAGRRADTGDTVLSVRIGYRLGRGEVFGCNVDLATNTLDVIRRARVIKRALNLYSAGSAFAATAPLSAAVTFPTNANQHFFFVFAQQLPQADMDKLLAWIRSEYNFLLQINDAAQSWHSSPRSASVANDSVVTFGFTTSTGQRHRAEVDAATGALLDEQVVDLAVEATQDDHNFLVIEKLPDGGIIDASGIHNNATGTGDNGRVQASLNVTDRISSLVRRFNLPSTMTFGNYGQFLKSTSKIWLFTNDDADRTWQAFWADLKKLSFTETRAILQQNVAPGAGSNQAYLKAAQPQIDTAWLFGYAHPSNLQNPLRLAMMDLETGTMTVNGVAVGSALDAGAVLALLPDCPAIYTPGTGRSLRLLGSNPGGDILPLATFDDVDPTVTNATHHWLIYDGVGDPNLAASWQLKDVGPTTAFYQSYVGDMQIALEPHAGIRAYRIWKDAANWKLDKVESLDQGATITSTTLYSTTNVLTRVIVTGNAKLPVIFFEGRYTTFQNWALRARFLLASDAII